MLLIALAGTCLLALCAKAAAGRPMPITGQNGIDATEQVSLECSPAYAAHLHIGIGAIQGELLRCARLANRETNESAESANCNGEPDIVFLVDWIVGSSRIWSIEI